MSKRVFVIGGATVDTIIDYEEMEMMQIKRRFNQESYLLLGEGKKIEVKSQDLYSGGGATNTAVSFQRHGFEVTLFCKIGQDVAGEFVRDDLHRYGVDTQHMLVSKSCGTSSSFVVPALSGDRTVFAYRGANATLLTEDLPLALLDSQDFIYITSLSLASAARLPEITSAAKACGIPVAVNPGISQLRLGTGFLKRALAEIDILILNFEEAQQLMVSLLMSDEAMAAAIAEREQVSQEDGHLLDAMVNINEWCFSLRHFFHQVRQLGPRVVSVTDGERGVYVASEEGFYFHAAIGGDVVNTLGAGDAFGSGFAAALYDGTPLPDAIRCGILNATAVIAHPDAKTGLLTCDQMQDALTQIDRSLLREIPS